MWHWILKMQVTVTESMSMIIVQSWKKIQDSTTFKTFLTWLTDCLYPVLKLWTSWKQLLLQLDFLNNPTTLDQLRGLLGFSRNWRLTGYGTHPSISVYKFIRTNIINYTISYYTIWYPTKCNQYLYKQIIMYILTYTHNVYSHIYS